MNLARDFSRRYLFSRRRAQFINVISGVTIFGLSLGSAALVLVLSVFNGFEDLIEQMISGFNPDIKILPVQGKYFDADVIDMEQIRSLPGVANVSSAIEEVAIFEYDNVTHPGKIKGVDNNWKGVANIDSAMIDGYFLLNDRDESYAVIGAGVARNLSIDILNVFKQLAVYMADRRVRSTVGRQFKTRYIRPSGVFSIQQELDNEIVIVPLGFAQELLDQQGAIGSIEIRVERASEIKNIKNQIQLIAGQDFQVLNRYEQDESFLKLMNIEKWMAYGIVSMMIFLVSFNMIGNLWMVMLDKKKDIAVLKAMGATGLFIRSIFIRLGLRISLIGILVGFLLAGILYGLQKYVGLITIPQGFIIDTYPISLRFVDLVAVFVTVLVIGALASLPAALTASRISASIREQ